METNRGCLRICILVLYISIAAICFTHCDARRSMQLFKGPKHSTSSIIKHTKKSKVFKHLDIVLPLDSLNSEPYGVSSPFSLPPFDSLAPIPLPENTPPFCIYPPFTPQPPSTTIPTPTGYTPSPPPPTPLYFPPLLPIPSPPPSPTGTVPSPPESSPTPNPPETFPSPPESSPTPNPPETFPSPPEAVPSPPSTIPGPPETFPNPPSNIPGSPEFVPSPPINVPGPNEPILSPPSYEPSPPSYVPSPPSYEPSPPSYIPSPPSYVPSPGGGGFVPSPLVFQPPVVYPPPTGPPPPYKGPSLTLWCVAKPTVPDPIIEEAMNYACGSGADCASIQPGGSCYQPETLLAHASYAFNSYWQRTKVGGGTCEFGGTAMLVTVDPSYDGCHFIYY